MADAYCFLMIQRKSWVLPSPVLMYKIVLLLAIVVECIKVIGLLMDETAVWLKCLISLGMPWVAQTCLFMLLTLTRRYYPTENFKKIVTGIEITCFGLLFLYATGVLVVSNLNSIGPKWEVYFLTLPILYLGFLVVVELPLLILLTLKLFFSKNRLIMCVIDVLRLVTLIYYVCHIVLLLHKNQTADFVYIMSLNGNNLQLPFLLRLICSSNEDLGVPSKPEAAEPYPPPAPPNTMESQPNVKPIHFGSSLFSRLMQNSTSRSNVSK